MSSSNELPSFTLPPFANKLIESGYINLAQMQQALIQKRDSSDSLLDILQAITGRPLPQDFVSQYKKDHLFNLKILHGIDVFDPETYNFDWQEVKQLIQTCIPLEVCRQYKLFPLKKRNHQTPSVVVAMLNPRDPQALNAMKDILRPTKMKLARKVITLQDFNQLIEKYLREQQPQDATQVSDEQYLETLVDLTDIFEDTPPNLEREENTLAEDLSLLDEREQNPVVTLVNNILLKALENTASEIQIDPQEDFLIVSFRQDGILVPAFEPIPKEIAGAVLARFRQLAQLNIPELAAVQKGRMQRNFSGRKIDFWLNILPDRYGEKIIIKIIDPKIISLDLEELVTFDHTRELVQNLMSRSSGLLLVTGPEASGVSTTLATLLTQGNKLGVNIATVEDPIERNLPSINQVEVNREMGRDYNSILQSFLDQNVDLIGVDQIRGRNTAKAVVDAAVSHLVLSGLSTSDVASAIVRLQNMNVDASSLAESLIGVINQRLVRRLCPVCRLSYQPTASEVQKLGLSSLLNRNISCYKANTLTADQIEQARSKGRLCRNCNGRGYKGQIGIYEVMGISPQLKNLILQGEDAKTIKKAALQEGMKSLLAYGIELVLRGETTFEELERVLGNESLFLETKSSSRKGSSSSKLLRRLQVMENMLLEFTQEFKQLKQEIESANNTSLEFKEKEIYEELKEPQEWEKIKAELELNQEITASHKPIVYEELTDPGDWEQLKQDFDPDKETMVSSSGFDEDFDPDKETMVSSSGFDEDFDPDKETIVSQSDSDEDIPDFNINTSFRSLSDPWSN